MGIVVGLIGLRHPHSRAYLRSLDALDVVDSVALYDADAAALDSTSQLSHKASARYDDIAELLARPDVPIVLVALPTNRVPEVVVQAARAGKHVICEKPCARNAQELNPVLAALEAHRVQFTACYLWRANPAIQKMRELVRAGALGRLTSVELRMVTTQVALRDPSHWLFQREIAGGGILSWLGCHWLDLLRYLTDQEVVQVNAMVDVLSGEAIDVEDVASVNLRLRNGALASLYAGYLLPSGRAGYEGAGYDQSIILRGTRGTLRHGKEGDDQVVVLESVADEWRTAPRQVYRYTLPNSPAYGGSHGLAFLDDFIRLALSGEGHNLVTVQDALRVLEILDAAYQSARTGQVVELPMDKPFEP
ncbi:MAG TPA: Gfo/Idh/MocA family oxidoreductase [Chloroflexota bacterium]|nr:Gfo/Idh/MocA family oxidoreductase [Chloroflexota bacterium]